MQSYNIETGERRIQLPEVVAVIAEGMLPGSAFCIAGVLIKQVCSNAN